MKKIILSLFLFFVLGGVSQAATLYSVSSNNVFGVGQEFEVGIKIDTEESNINAAQAFINYPSDIFEVVSVDRGNSVFNFWVEEPNFSESGKISFIGGLAKGVSGGSLHVFNVKFKTRGAGSGEISMSDAVITASDGLGTNVLSTTKNLGLSVGTNVVTSTPPVIDTSNSDVVVEQPQVLQRQAVTSNKLPIAPEVRVPFYPDQAKWYNTLTWNNNLGRTVALWDVPEDISSVAFTFDSNPNTEPEDIEEGVVTGKDFSILNEGIWFLHVQFRNNIGWGPVTHYKISVDTTAPLSFEIETNSEATRNPSPTISFSTQDVLSGVSHYEVFLDGESLTTTSTTTYKFSSLEPGLHDVVVKAYDFAGNSIQDNLDLEIIPLDTPIVTYITDSVSQGEYIYVTGESLPDVDVMLFIREKDREVLSDVIRSDSLGKWEFVVDKSLSVGRYDVSVSIRDDRGAKSFESEPLRVRVGSKVILSLGFIDLTWFEIFLVIVLIFSIASSIILWIYIEREKKRDAYKMVAGRDVNKMADLILSRVSQLEAWHLKERGLDMQAKNEVDALLKQIKEDLAKMKKYIGKELEDV